MSRILSGLLIVFITVLGGCSSTPSNEGIDTSKAAEANARLGLRYMQQSNYEVAMNKFKKALAFDNSYGPAHHYLAELYRRLDKYEDADKEYREAIYYSEDDTSSSLYNNYGGFLCARERYKEGEKQFLKVLKNPVYRRTDQVYENLGVCVERIPNLERAESYLRSGLKINPRMPKALLAMARVSFSKGEYLSTRAYLQRYLAEARHTAETLWLGIRAERLLGDKNAVSSYALLLKANFPNSAEAKLYIQSGG